MSATSPAPAERPAPNPAIEQFAAERRANVEAMASDACLRSLTLQWVIESAPYKYAYNFDWLGRPVIQYPQDLMALQDLIWRTRPTLIVETGVAHGGSLVFFASMLKLLGEGGRVVGVDVEIRPHNRAAIEAHPVSDAIQLVEGSSIDPETIRRVRAAVRPGDRVMVVLDSCHTHAHVLAELKAYAPLVARGCYLVVFDTILEELPAGFAEDRPWDKGDNPRTAVAAFLERDDAFEIDESIPDRLVITAARDGYLRRVR